VNIRTSKDKTTSQNKKATPNGTSGVATRQRFLWVRALNALSNQTKKGNVGAIEKTRSGKLTGRNRLEEEKKGDPTTMTKKGLRQSVRAGVCSKKKVREKGMKGKR